MKKLSILFLFGFFLFSSVNANAQLITINAAQKETKILELVLKTLKDKHINPKKLDDDFSINFFNHYLNELDKCKIFLLQSDIDEFKKFETKLDDQLKANDLSFFFLTYDRYILRMKEGKELFNNILKNQLDFTKNEESLSLIENQIKNVKSNVFAKNKNEQILRWNNLLKSLVLDLSTKEYIFNNKTNLTLKEIFNNKVRNLPEFLESSIFNYFNIDKERVFRLAFLNTIFPQFDSNSEYYTSKAYSEFLNTKTKKEYGIGIKFSQGKDFLKVNKIAQGSIAEKSNKIEVGDAVLKIEPENHPAINVTSFTLSEVNKVNYGEHGTTVRITFKKINGTIYEVPIKIGITSANDNYIKSCLVKKDNTTFGVISFSNFYNDLQEDKSIRVAETDFAEELESLKQENVTGIILDLRENAGESAIAAVKILENFLVKTPITLLKTQNKSEILQTENTTKNWDKNVVVLVNHKTAAAAELIANTFQEYNIGIVIGELTHGKNSIEKFQDLNALVPDKKEGLDLGVLSVSNQKFYNLNGKSVQKKGVLPDVIFNKNDKLDREALYPQSLAPDEVKPIAFVPVNKKNYFAIVIKNSQNRLSKSENFRRINDQIAEDISFETKLAQIKTLNLEKLTAQVEALLASEKVIEKPIFDKKRLFSLPSASIKALKKQEYLVAKRNAWLEELKTDFQIDEGINILEDMLLLEKK